MAAREIDLVTVDLDGTLIRGTVFVAVARGEGLAERFEAWDAAYFAGEMDLEECFRREFRALVGLPVDRLLQHLDAHGDWVPGIGEAVDRIHDAGAEAAVLTDQPTFLARHLEPTGFDAFLGSDAEVADGRVTGRIEERFDKVALLDEHLEAQGIRPGEVAHVGNGTNDVPVFQHVGASVAVDPSEPAVAEAADAVLDPLEDLRDAVDLLV